MTNMEAELRRRGLSSAQGDPLRAIDDLLDVMWKASCAVEDGVPLPFGTWLVGQGWQHLAAETEQLRDDCNTLGDQARDEAYLADRLAAALEMGRVFLGMAISSPRSAANVADLALGSYKERRGTRR